MDRRVALAAALLSAGLAVAIVAADLQFNVNVSLETLQDGDWVVVASQGEDGYAAPRYPGTFGGCAAPDMRLLIHNDMPWSSSREVRITVIDYAAGRSETLVSDDVTVARGATMVLAFTVPAWAQNVTTGPDDFPTSATVEARVGNTYLNTCVEAP